MADYSNDHWLSCEWNDCDKGAWFSYLSPRRHYYCSEHEPLFVKQFTERPDFLEILAWQYMKEKGMI